MHPILTRGSYLGAYLAVWLPLACLLIFLVRVSGGMGDVGVGSAVRTDGDHFRAGFPFGLVFVSGDARCEARASRGYS